MNELDILDQTLKQLSLSNDFLERSASMGFKTLRGIVDAKPEQLVSHPSFSYHWLAEVSAFLAQKSLLHLIQPLHS